MREIAKYITVANWLRDEINNRKLKEGDKLYSETILTQKFGLSRQTIRQSIELLEKEGLVIRRQGSGTYIAESPVRKRSSNKTIGFISTYIDSYIFPSIISEVEWFLSKNNYTMQLSHTRNQVEYESRCLKLMLEKNVDGIIVEPTKSALPNPNLQLYDEIRKKHIPLIFLNAYYQNVSFAHVSLDDRAAGKLATNCLIQAGHTKIAAMFQVDDLQGHLRYAGYLEAMTQAGIDIHSKNILWYTTEDINSFSEDFARVKRLISDCTSMVCYNDQIAYMVVNELEKCGILVPEDISVVGIDGSDLSAMCKVPLTTIANPFNRLGKTVAQNILKLIEDPNYNATVDFQPKLIERESVKVLNKGLF